jgi:hypothetical protein
MTEGRFLSTAVSGAYVKLADGALLLSGEHLLDDPAGAAVAAQHAQVYATLALAATNLEVLAQQQNNFETAQEFNRVAFEWQKALYETSTEDLPSPLDSEETLDLYSQGYADGFADAVSDETTRA